MPRECYATDTDENTMKTYQDFLLSTGTRYGDVTTVPITPDMWKSNFHVLAWDRLVWFGYLFIGWFGLVILVLVYWMNQPQLCKAHRYIFPP